MAKILVIDDDAFNLKLAVTVLGQAGHEVLSADGGQAGLALALSAAPDLVVLDVQMPGLDGLDTLRRLRADERTAHTRVIALTALAMKSDHEWLLEAGFDDYLGKPIRYKELLDRVHDLLSAQPALLLSAAAAQAGAQAHMLKSSAQAVGALALGDLCEQIEGAGKGSALETLTPLLQRLEQEMSSVNRFLDNHVQRLSAPKNCLQRAPHMPKQLSTL